MQIGQILKLIVAFDVMLKRNDAVKLAVSP